MKGLGKYYITGAVFLTFAFFAAIFCAFAQYNMLLSLIPALIGAISIAVGNAVKKYMINKQ